jgi:hypothetical protein
LKRLPHDPIYSDWPEYAAIIVFRSEFVGQYKDVPFGYIHGLRDGVLPMLIPLAPISNDTVVRHEAPIDHNAIACKLDTVVFNGDNS